MNDLITIDWNLLNDISYRSNLGKSLKNTLRKFDKEELFEEIANAISYFIQNESQLNDEHRIKSLHSCVLKYEKHFPSKEVEKVFNDILGIRIIIDDYSILDKMMFPEQTKIADMRYGKINDDGYRGIHIYYQKDHNHYPIELQFMTAHDRQFNEWLHIYLYKYVDNNKIGAALRRAYEEGLIQTEDDFREEMKKYVLSSS